MRLLKYQSIQSQHSSYFIPSVISLKLGEYVLYSLQINTYQPSNTVIEELKLRLRDIQVYVWVKWQWLIFSILLLWLSTKGKVYFHLGICIKYAKVFICFSSKYFLLLTGHRKQNFTAMKHTDSSRTFKTSQFMPFLVLFHFSLKYSYVSVINVKIKKIVMNCYYSLWIYNIKHNKLIIYLFCRRKPGLIHARRPIFAPGHH